MSVRAVLAVWSLALIAAGGGVALILSSDRPWPAASIVLAVVIGLAFVGSGLLARVRRPENRTGVLLMLVGFSWFGVALGSSDRSLVWTLGYAEGAVIVAFFVHLVLAFPSGRLETKAERRVVAGACMRSRWCSSRRGCSSTTCTTSSATTALRTRS